MRHSVPFCVAELNNPKPNTMLTIVQSDPDVPAGTIADCLSSNHVPYRIIRVFSGETLPWPAASSAVIVLGGSMGVHDVARFPFLSAVKSYIGSVVARTIPLLGICLGGQLLADVLGARVHMGRFGEKGMQSIRLLDGSPADPLFLGVPEQFPTFQWHDDSFELPEGATLLASSAVCANQAFRYGPVTYGLQFHPEVTGEIVASWSGSSPDGPDKRVIMDEFLRTEARYRSIARRLLENYLHIAGLVA